MPSPTRLLPPLPCLGRCSGHSVAERSTSAEAVHRRRTGATVVDETGATLRSRNVNTTSRNLDRARRNLICPTRSTGRWTSRYALALLLALLAAHGQQAVYCTAARSPTCPCPCRPRMANHQRQKPRPRHTQTARLPAAPPRCSLLRAPPTLPCCHVFRPPGTCGTRPSVHHRRPPAIRSRCLLPVASTPSMLTRSNRSTPPAGKTRSYQQLHRRTPPTGPGCPPAPAKAPARRNTRIAACNCRHTSCSLPTVVPRRPPAGSGRHAARPQRAPVPDTGPERYRSPTPTPTIDRARSGYSPPQPQHCPPVQPVPSGARPARKRISSFQTAPLLPPVILTLIRDRAAVAEAPGRRCRAQCAGSEGSASLCAVCREQANAQTSSPGGRQAERLGRGNQRVRDAAPGAYTTVPVAAWRRSLLAWLRLDWDQACAGVQVRWTKPSRESASTTRRVRGALLNPVVPLRRCGCLVAQTPQARPSQPRPPADSTTAGTAARS